MKKRILKNSYSLFFLCGLPRKKNLKKNKKWRNLDGERENHNIENVSFWAKSWSPLLNIGIGRNLGEKIVEEANVILDMLERTGQDF